MHMFAFSPRHFIYTAGNAAYRYRAGCPDCTEPLRAVMHHFDGAAWHVTETGLEGRAEVMWGSGPADVWASLRPGWLLRYDGRDWQEMAAAIPHAAQQIVGRSARDVFVRFEGGSLYHHDGETFSEVTSDAPVDNVAVVAGDLWETA